MPPRPRNMELLFPAGGMVRRYGYQQQAPYTTYDCSNVWPFDPLEGRQRGGSRPGTEKAFAELLGSGNPIQCLASVEVINADATIGTVLAAIANGTLSRSAAGAALASNELVSNGDLEAGTGDTFTDWVIDEASPGTVEETATVHGGSRACKISQGNPSLTNQISQVVTTVPGDSYTLTFWTRGDGSNDGKYAVKDNTNNVNILGATSTGVTGTAYTRVSYTFTAPAAGPLPCVAVRIYLKGPAAVDSVAYFDEISVLPEDENFLNSSAATLQATAHKQKLYIADYRPTRVYGADGVIASDDQLDAGSDPDWTTLGIDLLLDVVHLTDVAADDTEDGIYAIESVTTNYIVVDVPAPLTAGSCTYELGRTIKVFDPSDNSMAAIVPTFGIPPLNCHLICTYRDRIVAVQGNTWYMSRSGDATDWDYAYDPTDVLRPVASGIGDAGYVGPPVTALIPHADDFLIFGCEKSLWMLRGDPAGGGQLDAISREVGIVSGSAWCKLPDASIVFLSRQGLFVLSPGDSNPQPLSREMLPEELLDVDVTANTVALQYDGRYQGIHIFITPTAGTAGDHWFLDWTNKGFFGVSLPAAQQPCVLLGYAADQGETQTVLQGCHDGYLRQYNRAVVDDDGTTLTSYVILGPVRLAPPGNDAILAEMGATLDEDSNDVTWEIMVGDSGEAVADQATARATGTWVAGYNRVSYPRVRGPAAKLKLSATDEWAMEFVHLVIAPAGRKR